MKNIVVLKNLPSNLVDEAIVVLKSNTKVKKLQYSENKNEKKNKDNRVKEDSNKEDYIIKEAEIVIADYINKIENQNIRKSNTNKELEKKYKKLKKCTVALGFFLGFTIFLLVI